MCVPVRRSHMRSCGHLRASDVQTYPIPRRSSRDPSNAWSKPLVIRAAEGKRDGGSRRCLDLPSSSSTSSSPARPGKGDGESGDVVTFGAQQQKAVTRQTAARGDASEGTSSLTLKRAGSPDSGLHYSPAPSNGNRSSEERHGSRSRNNSG